MSVRHVPGGRVVAGVADLKRSTPVAVLISSDISSSSRKVQENERSEMPKESWVLRSVCGP